MEPLDLAYPFTGRWRTQNSPANRTPSHGTALFATSFAIDFVPVDATGRTAPIRLGSLLRPEPAERFPGFGRRILAPAEGLVVAVHDTLSITTPSAACRRWVTRSPSAAGQPRAGLPSRATT